MDVATIVAFEDGELSPLDTVKLFSELVATGTAWTLQGSYGRFASHLIDAGVLDINGDIDWERFAEVTEDA